MVVVAAGRDEQRAGVAAHDDVEAEHAVVERLRLLEVGDLQVDVAEHGAVGDGRVRGRGVDPGRHVVDHAVEVERQRRHSDLAVGLVVPLGARAVAVDLDPVALGVAEVERLADEVVGGAFERVAGGRQAAQGERQVGARRQQDREVEEAGGAARPLLGVGAADQLQQRRAVGRAERRLVTVVPQRHEPDHLLVEGGLGREVVDRQADRAE